MITRSKISVLLLRLSLGWLFLYAGITKVINPNWSAASYLTRAQTFSDFYAWLSSPINIGWVNFVNEWGLILLGTSLILGLGLRLSAPLGILLMLSYYFPVLSFPYVGGHSYIIDEHIIYSLSLLLLTVLNAGRIYGLDKWVQLKLRRS